MAMNRKRLFATLLLIALTIVAAACGASKDAFENSEGKIKITTTIGMITDIAQQVGKEHVEVVGLMKSGVDPHLYKASQGDIAKLDQADIIFYNGLHLEGKMVEIFERMTKQKPTVAVSSGIDPANLRLGDEAMGTEYDPHIWFDVRHWISATMTIRDALIAFDSAHAEDYRLNAEAYIKQLEELHQEVAEKIKSIPEQSRVLVTAHDAFGYFGDAYGIKVMGLQGISTASEAGTKDVTDLRDYLVDNKIKAVFIESSVPRKAIDAVIQGAKEKGHEIQIGGELFSDAMGEAGTPEGTYIGMVRHNVDTIVNALR
ncbi:metal ABC transporter solute-binding protein, Zn/Mn family [Brevibacillus sp. B_LB10_24]|uniref:metal ABC transporter solute-binding protein, Zn/Mn family n=1 Tax=Brevibacillus sp. B_LB10_24 TaxID=3380645 RepID=UPI0038BB4BC9